MSRLLDACHHRRVFSIHNLESKSGRAIIKLTQANSDYREAPEWLREQQEEFMKVHPAAKDAADRLERSSAMSVDAKYKTTATASRGGRDGGRTELADGTLALNLVVPKELGGPGGDGANPEKLFALGYSACFLGALRVAAAQSKSKIPAESTVTATIGIGPRSEGGFGITAELDVNLPGLAADEAARLVATTHGICPYSNAIKASVDVKTTTRV